MGHRGRRRAASRASSRQCHGRIAVLRSAPASRRTNVRSVAERRRRCSSPTSAGSSRRSRAPAATRRLVGTAAPEPGVLLSRFVESWPARPPDLPLGPGRPLVDRPPTAGVQPLHADGRLRLSASRLDTYDDCPLRYAYEYVLHVRRDAGVQAWLGSLFHEVLAQFLDPNRTEPRTRDALIALARRALDATTSRATGRRPKRPAATTTTCSNDGGKAEGTHSSSTGQGPEVLDVERRFTHRGRPAHRERGHRPHRSGRRRRGDPHRRLQDRQAASRRPTTWPTTCSSRCTTSPRHATAT